MYFIEDFLVTNKRFLVIIEGLLISKSFNRESIPLGLAKGGGAITRSEAGPQIQTSRQGR